MILAGTHCSSISFDWMVELPNSGIPYQEACTCKPHSPISAFSMYTGDILVFRLPYSFVLYLSWFKTNLVWEEKCWLLGSPYPKGAYFVWLFSAPHTQPCRSVTSFSLLQKTLCTPSHLPGQALASHIKWKVRHTSSQRSPWDRSSDPVFKKKQSSERTEFTVPSGRNGMGAPHSCYSGWFWVGAWTQE